MIQRNRLLVIGTESARTVERKMVFIDSMGNDTVRDAMLRLRQNGISQRRQRKMLRRIDSER